MKEKVRKIYHKGRLVELKELPSKVKKNLLNLWDNQKQKENEQQKPEATKGGDSSKSGGDSSK